MSYAADGLLSVQLDYALDEILTDAERYIRHRTSNIPWNKYRIQKDDGVQEVLLNVYRKLSYFDPSLSTIQQALSYLVDQEIARLWRRLNNKKERFFVFTEPYIEEDEPDVIPTGKGCVEDGYGLVELRMALSKIDFTNREKEVVAGLLEGYTLTDIGKQLGLTQGRVSQIKRDVVKKVKGAYS